MNKKILATSKVLTNQENDELREAFNLFDTKGTGKVNPSELKLAMESLGLKDKNPVIYKMIADLDTKDSSNRGGITYDTFLDAVSFRLCDKDSKDGVRRMYDLFIDDPDTHTITINALSKVTQELGNHLEPKELNELLMRASNNGCEITFDEFYAMVTKK